MSVPIGEYERGGTQKAEYGPDEVVAVACPMCEARGGERLYTEHRSIGIERCSVCGLIYTSPRLREPEHVYWGSHDTYVAEARLIFSGAATHHRDPNYLEELDMIERLKPQRGRFLDVGCNMGMLLRHARDRGWSAVGVEPSPALHRIATQEFGLEVHNCFLEELPASQRSSFDALALSDVFEHVTAPRELLRAARELLKPDGVLYVKVPNARWSLFKQRAARSLGRAPDAGVWDSYEHVVHYTEETLRAMLRAGGFEPLHITIGRPVQIPAWHRYVGHYYQYPSPWILDWRRFLVRRGAYELARVDRRLRKAAPVGGLAPNLVALARVAGRVP